MTAEQAKSRSSVVPMVIVAILFFVLGFATWLNGSLMPYLKQMLTLSPFQASLVVFSFYIAVTFTALPSAWIIRKVGYKSGMALGMATMPVPTVASLLRAGAPAYTLARAHFLRACMFRCNWPWAWMSCRCP